jgi:hypothetical protein
VDIRPATWKRIFWGGIAPLVIFFAAFARLMTGLICFVVFGRLEAAPRRTVLRVGLLAALREGREPPAFADFRLPLRVFIGVTYGV